ncbi:MAG TPA: MFS transporter [Spirochaetia bacterium]|nr:MFS transporter [Spirochaetia bacterium]
MDRKKLAALLSASFFYWIGLYLYVPTLPEFVRRHSPTLAAVGVVLSMYGLWQGVVRIPLGVTVDATGRGKPYLILGFILTALGAVVMAKGTTVTSLTVGRAITGLAAGTWVPLIVVFSGYFPPKQAVFATSLLTMSNSFGRILATSATGVLNAIGGYSLPFYLAAASAGISVIIIGATKIERREVHAVSVSSIAKIFVRGDVLLPSFISAIGQIGNWAVTLGFMPILATQAGAGEIEVGLLIGLNVVASMVGNLLNTVVTRRISRTSLLYGAFALFSAGIVFIALIHSIVLFFVGSFVIGLSTGFSYPTLMGLSIERVDQSHRTTAMGIHQAVYSIGMFVGPWIGGIVADAIGIRWMFGATAALCLVGSYTLIAVRKRVLAASA